MTPMEQSNCQTDNGNVLDELLKASRILEIGRASCRERV